MTTLHARLRRIIGGYGFPAYPLHSSEPYAPFFMVGSGRSGSTLLRSLLQASPEVHIPPEIWTFKKNVRRYRRYRYIMQWDDLVYLVLARCVHHSEFEPAFRNNLAPLISKLLSAPENVRSLAYVINELYCYHGRVVGAEFSRWGDKTPRNALCLKEIVAVFPRAKFIHLIRDGADVIGSFIAADFPWLSGCTHAAKLWQKSVTAAHRFAKRHPAHCIEIRYEDLVRDPHSVVEKVCEFIDIDYNPSLIDAQHHWDQLADLKIYPHHGKVFSDISSAGVGKGRRSLTSEQRQEIAALIDHNLEYFGYEPLIKT